MTDKRPWHPEVFKNPWLLLNHIIYSQSLYILGAGASRSIIGATEQIGTYIRNKFWENGVFPAQIQPDTPLKRAILRPSAVGYNSEDQISQEELDLYFPSEVLEVLLAQQLTKIRPLKERNPYEIFNSFYPSVILNFNVDNLADCITKNHLILYPHGRIQPNIAHHPYLSHRIEWLYTSQSDVDLFRYHRPLPEPSSITSKKAYQKLKEIFPSINYICIIGYSFGSWSGSIDDSESYEMIIDLIKWRPKPILIINPYPFETVSLIETVIRQKLVFWLACEWDVLAKFISCGKFKSSYRASRGSKQFVTDAYLHFIEKSHEDLSSPFA